MEIGGLVKQSLIDYPGKIASVIFTRGCNFRCGYCHNPALVIPELMDKNRGLAIDGILSFLAGRRDWLDAVVVTGGEPTLHADLPEFLGQIKNMGYLVKLDTNGTNPVMIKKIIDKELVDYIAMDVKAPLEGEAYAEITGIREFRKMGELLAESVELLKKTVAIEVEFRTTMIPEIHDEQVMDSIKLWIGPENRLNVNVYREGGTISDHLSRKRQPL